MELTEQQKSAVEAWVREGCGLSEIQRRLESEFGLRLTFMDVRFLILDLGLEIRDPKSSSADQKSAATDVSEESLPDEPEDAPFPPPGGVSVTVDRIVKPGALVSGNVTFSDGVKAAWMLDQFGRLALDPSVPGYRPTQDDVEAFQRTLQDEMARKGF